MTQILIVDHDNDRQQLLAQLLSSNGYTVLTASNGAQAMRAVLSEAPEILIAEWDEHIALYLRSNQLAIANQQLEEANEKLRVSAATDELTGLLNRREGNDRIREYWASGSRHDVPLACVLVDVDDFKAFNDTHGHAVGDAVLRHTAKMLRIYSREDEVVCRWGGEEFLILCPQSTAQAAFEGAKRLVSEIANRPLCCAAAGRRSGCKSTIHITISAGVAERESTMQLPEDLIEAADTAMYAAKEAGKNRAHKASPITCNIV